LCNHLKIHNITVDSDTYWNNDGIDIVDCKNVQISDCDINASDDGICIKSEDWTRERFCDSITISNCSVRSSASAIKLGTSSVSHMRNISIRNIKVYDTYRSAIAIEAMQGGVVENILVENITATNTGNAIFMRIGQIRGAKHPGILRNIVLRKIKVQVPFDRPDKAYTIRGPSLPFFHNVLPSSITGIVGHPIESVLLEDITIIHPGRGKAAYANLPLNRISDVPELPTKYPEFSMFGELPAWGFYVRHVEGLKMKNVIIRVKKADYRPALVVDDAKGLKFDNLKIKGDKKNDTVFMKNVQ
jgi:polygalacturonase